MNLPRDTDLGAGHPFTGLEKISRTPSYAVAGISRTPQLRCWGNEKAEIPIPASESPKDSRGQFSYGFGRAEFNRDDEKVRNGP